MHIHSAPAPSSRLIVIDAARGVAILAMMIYHLAWDLHFHNFITADVSGGLGWRIFARMIAGSFLFLVGVGLALAAERGMNWARYLRRLALVSAAAAAITVVTWFIFPNSYIFFGILHCIAASSILALPFLRLPVAVALISAAACLAAPWFLADPFFDHPALRWLGLMTYFPQSNDYVPIFPWFGMVLAGLGMTRIALRWWPAIRAGWFRGAPVTQLAWAGRHSLPIYLIHQPVFFGLVWLAAAVVPPNAAAVEARFVESCAGYCMADGTGEAICRQACTCLVDEARTAGIWADVLAERLSAPALDLYRGLAQQCRATALEE